MNDSDGTFSGSSAAHEQRPNKKLRCCEPDCKVILKFSGGEKEYMFHSAILANLSTVVDEALEGGSDTKKEIVFDDVKPQTFKNALKFVQAPEEARNMSCIHVEGVVGFYHKYDFGGGLRLCDQVLKSFFERVRRKFWKLLKEGTESRSGFDNFGMVIGEVVLADKYHLQEALKVGLEFLQSRLDSTSVPFGCSMFTEDHAKVLQPLFVRGQLKCYGLSKREELESEMFPKLMVLSLSKYHALGRVHELTVRGTDSAADGSYKFNMVTGEYETVDGQTGELYGETVKYCIHRYVEDNWCICARPTDEDDDDGTDNVLWRCPHSKNLDYPPKGPWLEVMGDKDKKVQVIPSKMRP